MNPQALIDSINKEAESVKSLHDLIRESLIPQGIEIPKPDLVFGINGVSVFTKRSISTLIGRAKSGKTTVTSWIVSNSIRNNISVLWVDTEQGLYYGSRTQHWILSMSGIQTSDYLQFYDLKTFNPSKRVEMIEIIIKEFTPDLVVIDGIRDLVFDINSPEEATIRTGDLMRWADQYNCHIMNILHQNKGNDHARGHLGTEMINKSETVIKVEQNEDKLIVCSPEFTRSEPFEIFAFDRDDRGMPQIVDGFAGQIIATTGKSGKTSVDPTDSAYNFVHPQILDHVFSKTEFLTKEEMNKNIMHYFQVNGAPVGRNKAIEFTTHYLQSGMVWKNPHIKGHAKFHKHPKYVPLIWTENEKVQNINVNGILSTKQDEEDDCPF